MPKLQPCERMLNLTIPDGLSAIDSSWLLSQQNRRAYRQGMEYAFANFEIMQPITAAGGLVRVYVIPRTWVSANAWVKAYSVWRNQRHEAMAESETWSRQGKYADFKVYFNSGHATGTDPSGLPVNAIEAPNDYLTLAGATVVDPGAQVEWAYSTFVVPNVSGSGGTTEEFYGLMTGPDSGTAKSLITAYAESRARPFPLDPSNVEMASPGIVPGGLFAEMIDVGEDMLEILEGISDQNDSPPYVVGGVDSNAEFYPGGMVQGSDRGMLEDYLIIRASTALATDSTGPFTAYCGLLFIDNGTGESIQAQLEFAPGPYQGVMARKMQDVN